MPGHRPAVYRPRPDDLGRGSARVNSSFPGGEGGNRSSRLAVDLNPNTLLAAALVGSATFIGIATAVIH